MSFSNFSKEAKWLFLYCNAYSIDIDNCILILEEQDENER